MLEWIKGERHPDTPIAVYQNVRDYDHVRRVLIARCKQCGQVISTDELKVRELNFRCPDPTCYCKRQYATQLHRVCEACYDMWHALYFNSMLKNMNYWKELDEAEAKLRSERNRRMGLDDK